MNYKRTPPVDYYSDNKPSQIRSQPTDSETIRIILLELVQIRKLLTAALVDREAKDDHDECGAV